jgi:hypothetical protein
MRNAPGAESPAEPELHNQASAPNHPRTLRSRVDHKKTMEEARAFLRKRSSTDPAPTTPNERPRVSTTAGDSTRSTNATTAAAGASISANESGDESHDIFETYKPKVLARQTKYGAAVNAAPKPTAKPTARSATTLPSPTPPPAIPVPAPPCKLDLLKPPSRASWSNQMEDHEASIGSEEHETSASCPSNAEINPELKGGSMMELIAGLKTLVAYTTMPRDRKAAIMGMVNEIRKVAERQSEAEAPNHSGIAKDLADIKATILKSQANVNDIRDSVTKAIAAPPTRTWAHVAAASESAIVAETAKQERREKLKIERAKQEIAISLHEASESTVMKMSSLKQEAELTKFLQSQINGPMRQLGKHIKLLSAKRTSAKTLKLYLNTPDDAAALRRLNWTEVLNGAKLQKQSYGIVVHGVSKSDFDPSNAKDAKEVLESSNDQVPINVLRVAPLMRKARNESAPTQSIVFFLEDPSHASHLTNSGVRIGRRFHYCEKYVPQAQISQCYNCQGFGHKAATCTKRPKCGKCSEGHDTRECTSNDTKCANCGSESHHAWHHECPQRGKELERLKIIKASIPPTFQPASPQ